MSDGRYIREVTWGYHPIHLSTDLVTSWSWSLINLSGAVFSYLSFFVNKLVLPFSSVTSILGFSLLISIAVQLLSGFFLAWYYIPEPGLVIELREEMFNDTRYGAEVFYFHVRGVDIIFALTYLHIFKKIYLKNYITCDAEGWMLGGYAFLFYHYIVALGICLSGSHLSDLTLTIIANIFWSLTDNMYKTYYVIFTNKHLNIDQLTRIMIFHYLTPWYYLYLVQVHIMFCHEGWDSDSGEGVKEDKSGTYISWFYDALLKEIQDAWYWIIITSVIFWMHYLLPHTINYFYFERWNISENDDIRFYGVAPHWYFRPLMGVLVISPTHYEGLMWIGLYFVLLACMPFLHNCYNWNMKHIPIIPMQNSVLQSSFFILFLLSTITVASMLPCGRYYYEPEGGYVGNPMVKFSLQYIYFYLGFLIYQLDLIDHFIVKIAKKIRQFYKNFRDVRKTQTRSIANSKLFN